MSEDDLENLKELRSSHKPRILTMYFEDGGEECVVPYDDYYDLQQENQKLKESEKNTYETSQEMLKEYVEENKHLKEQNEILSSKKPIKDLKRRNDELARRSREHEFREYLLERRLKQRDEVIEACIKSIEDFMTHIDDGFCADMMTFIDILNKCRGDNNE